MSYQVLARKWRPKAFSELSGQEHVVRALTNALEQQRLHHAYLFTGTRGVGKTTLARILAKSLNCEKGISSTPCGECGACREIDSGRFVDLLELDAASNTGIDNMREVLDNAQYAPTAGRFKVYIIDEVHMLSKAAFNSMLKTLEEPPEHVKFILATTDPQKIPVTVLSRCLQFNLKQIPPAVVADYLKFVLEQENIAGEPMALQLIARAASGSMRDALSLTDQAIAYGGGKVEEAAVRSMLGAIDQTYLFSLLRSLASQDGAGLMAEAERMAERSLSFDTALQDLGTLLHQIALAQSVPDALSVDLPERGPIMELAALFTPEDIQLFYQIALHGRRDLVLAPDEFAGFSMTLLRMLAFLPDMGASALPVVEAKRPAPARSAPAVAAPAPRVETAPAPILQPVQSAAAAPAVAAVAFDGDWPTLVNRLKLGGMARMLAQHCELKNHTDSLMQLVIPDEHKHLLEKPYQEKLRTSLAEYFGQPVKVEFSIGVISGMSPVVLENQEKQRKQTAAIASIEQDPFVRDLVENFDAKVIESSIKPIE
jgi:DNA polymerase-3 subunit gamma/tau